MLGSFWPSHTFSNMANLGDNLIATLMIFGLIFFTSFSFILLINIKKQLRQVKHLCQCQKPLQSHQGPTKESAVDSLECTRWNQNNMSPISTLNIDKCVLLIPWLTPYLINESNLSNNMGHKHLLDCGLDALKAKTVIPNWILYFKVADYSPWSWTNNPRPFFSHQHSCASKDRATHTHTS